MTASAPLVSVIIPAVRHDAWLDEAIASVVDDGYENLEVIVVWDGPPSAAPNSLGVRLVTSGQIGTPGANNVGLSQASGEFIARLDADDVSYPGRFQAQVDALRAVPEAPLVATNALVINSDSDVTGEYPRANQDALPRALLRTNTLVHSSLMFRKDAARYDQRCVRMQDYELILRMARSRPLLVVQGDYVGYRVHPGQTSRDTSAFWRYIPVVLRARRSLARSLGVREFVLQHARDAAWLAVQWFNHAGLRARHRRLVSGGS